MGEDNSLNFLRFTREADRLVDPRSVQVALDVGSRDGEIALRLRQHYPNARVFAFECNPPAVELCRQSIQGQEGITLVDRAVSDVSGPLDFFAIDPEKTVTPHADGNIGASSLYEASADYPYEKYVQRKVSVESITLAAWAKENGLAAIDVIWMDLQGGELRALQGLGDLIQTVRIIYTEVEYKPIYRGQPLAAEVRAFLQRQGFSLAATCNAAEWSGDELYCRNQLLSWWKRLRRGAR